MLGIDQFLAHWHVHPLFVIGFLGSGVFGVVLGTLGIINRYKPKSLLGSVTGKLSEEVIIAGLILGGVCVLIPISDNIDPEFLAELNRIRATKHLTTESSNIQRNTTHKRNDELQFSKNTTSPPPHQAQVTAQTKTKTIMPQPQVIAQPQPRKQSSPADDQAKFILSGLWLCVAFFLQRIFEKMFADKGYALLTVCATGFLLAFFTANYFLLGGSVTGGIMGSVGDRA